MVTPKVQPVVVAAVCGTVFDEYEDIGEEHWWFNIHRHELPLSSSPFVLKWLVNQGILVKVTLNRAPKAVQKAYQAAANQYFSWRQVKAYRVEQPEQLQAIAAKPPMLTRENFPVAMS